MRLDPQHNLTERVAVWASALTPDAIPDDVADRARLQVLSVLAAVHAGHRTDRSGRTVAEAATAWGGPAEATLVPTGARLPAASVAYAEAALGMTLDYDDYLFPAHTGHSAVPAALALAEARGAGGAEALAAVVAANELEGRLAGSALLGPLNGQMCSYIHRLGAAIVGARLRGLDADTTAHAVRLALYQPSHGLYDGFMGSEAKTLTASEGTRAGLDAAELAERGLTGTGDLIGSPRGFVETYAFVPLPYFFTGLGECWLTRTLCYKIYPGCAYIDTAVDAAIELAHEHDLDPADVDSVEVRASLLTTKMQELAAPYLRGPESYPHTLNFSIPYNVARALAHRALVPDHFTPEALAEAEVWALADRVHLVHDARFDLAVQQASAPFLHLPTVLRGRPGGLVRLAGHFLGRRDLGELGLTVGKAVRRVRAARSGAGRGRGLPRFLRTPDLGGADETRYRMVFGARVEVRTRGGATLTAERQVPVGAAGRDLEETREAVRRKFLQETRPALGEARARGCLERIERLESLDAGGLASLRADLCPGGPPGEGPRKAAAGGRRTTGTRTKGKPRKKATKKKGSRRTAAAGGTSA